MKATDSKLKLLKPAVNEELIYPQSSIIPSHQEMQGLSLKDEKFKLEVVKSIAQGECSIPEDLVERFNLTYEQAITLLSDSSFLTSIANYTKAKLNLTFHSIAVPKLQEIVKDDDPKVAIQAIKLAAQLTNNLKGNNTDVNINLSLENMISAAEKNVTPLEKKNDVEPIIDIEKVS